MDPAEQKKLEKVLELYEKEIKDHPDGEHGWQQKGLVLWQLGRQNEAMECFKHVKAFNIFASDNWVAMGEEYLKAKQVDPAIKCFEKAIEIDPKALQAWANLANLLSIKGQLGESIHVLQDAVKNITDNTHLWRMLGLTLTNYWRSQKDPKSNLNLLNTAVDALDHAIKINPKNIDAWNDFIRVWTYLEKPGEAMKCVDQVLNINPTFALGWFNKGILYALQFKKPKEAIECFDKALKIDPNNQQVKEWRTKVLSGKI